MALTATLAPDAYRDLVQEDRLVEWTTVALFVVAGLVRLHAALLSRRLFDGLVALFCVFVAGEEISWGQRLLGVTPPDYFLARNFQQEMNLHNFAAVFGEPRWILALALAGYGLLLPLVARSRAFRSGLDRIGATPPRAGVMPWFALAVLLLLTYPIPFTGEWTELLAGALFLGTSGLGPGGFGAGTALAVVFGGLLTAQSAAAADPGGRNTACAEVESEALLRDLVTGEAALPPLATMSLVHKRVYTAAQAGYIDLAKASDFASAWCAPPASENAPVRRRFAVDPWGMAYWVVSRREPDGSRFVAVYSMGPNQRRDGEAGTGADDDVAIYIVLGGTS